MLHKKVNFFIVGAPKSGTSFLRYHLGLHPNIFLPKEEPVFMCKDMNDLSNCKSLEEYLSIFGDNLEKDSDIISGEKSSNYLHSEDAYKEIFNYNLNAKIIICLRNPISACPSYHNHNKIMGFELINDFLEAWNSQKLRILKNYKIPLWARNEKNRYQYKNIYSYNIHVLKYLKTFGEKNVKIIFYEDIVNNKVNLFLELYKFLNVRDFAIPDFKVINKQPKINKINNTFKNKVHLYKVHFLKKKSIRNLSQIIKKIFRIKSFSYMHQFLNAVPDTKDGPSSNISYDLVLEKNHLESEKKIKELLLKDFKETILDLSKILNKNLDHWLK